MKVQQQKPERYIQVVTTVNRKKDAKSLARILLEKRLAACVQISPCTSLYHWQGKVESDDELRLTIKSKQSVLPALKKTLRKKHPYDTPEILVFSILDGNSDYLRWIDAELRDGGSDG